MRCIARVAFTCLALAVAQPSRADFVVSMSTSDNLATLQVGQTVTIDIVLSGDVSSSNPLDSLGVTVSDSSILFNTPSITAGSIVPDLSGFFTGPSTGVADATYDDLFANSGTPITANGLFFSAQFTAASVGTGTFTFTNLSGFQGFNSVNVINGTPDGLAYTITEQATPAPSSFLLAGLGVALLALYAASHALRPFPRPGPAGCRRT
jgi:hypothetical protein